MKDALGFEIKKDTLYGYSQRQNGLVTVVIGSPVKFSEKSVTLKVKHRGKAIYNEDIIFDNTLTYAGKPRRGTISVSGNTIFPITDSRVKWETKI